MKKLIVFLCLLLVFFALWGQPFALDTTFQSEHEFQQLYNQYLGVVGNLIEEPNGKITVIGGFQHNNKSSDIRHNIARLNKNGQIDHSWMPNSWLDHMSIADVKLNNGLYYFSMPSVGIARSDYNGDFFDQNNLPLDTNLTTGTHIPYVFPDGSMLVGGTGGKYPSSNNFQRRLFFMKIKPNGWVDSSFYHNTNSDVQKVMRYDSTHLLLYGIGLTHYDSIPINRICRIDLAGNLDTTFYAEPFTAWTFERGSPEPKYVQPDGKIIIGQRFIVKNHSTELGLIRLNSDGSLDTTFNNYNSLNGDDQSASTVCPTSDGGYLIGGFFTSYQGYPRNRIVKTDGDGFIDLNYFNGEGIDSSKTFGGWPASVRAIIPAQNDKYYVMGHFLKYNGEVVKPLIRILGLSHLVGIEKELKTPSLTVFPNPATDMATFSLEQNSLIHKPELYLYDIQGQEIGHHIFNSLEKEWIWETQQIKSGVYLYQLRTGSGEILNQGKVVIQK